VIEHMFGPLSIRPLLTLIAATACAIALVMGYASPSNGAAHPRHHQVRVGETLWSIAERAYPQSDPRDAVYRIQQANRLDDAVIVAGEELVLP
jgi:hypothetical protein